LLQKAEKQLNLYEKIQFTPEKKAKKSKKKQKKAKKSKKKQKKAKKSKKKQKIVWKNSIYR